MSRHNKSIVYLASLLVVTPASVLGFDAVEVAAGKASDGIDVVRLALHQSWSRRWLASSSGELTGYHAVSLNRWVDEGEAINAWAYSPVFVYQFRDAPVSYVKFGVGVAYLSDTQIKGRDLSSYFQFEDQLGIGWKWQEHDISLAYFHYSNAGIEEPNRGIDMVLLLYAFQLD